MLLICLFINLFLYVFLGFDESLNKQGFDLEIRIKSVIEAIKENIL